jgi:hypothetical protein
MMDKVLKSEYPQTPYTQAVGEGYVEEAAVASGRAVRTGEKHPTLDMVKGYMLRPEKWRENADLSCQCQGTVGIDSPCNDPSCYLRPTPTPPRCTVDEQPVEELAILIKPVAFLVTTEHGTHEFTRLYFQKGEFSLGVDLKRLGGIAVRAAEFDTGRAPGLRIHFDKGYEMFIPREHCQATWRRVE